MVDFDICGINSCATRSLQHFAWHTHTNYLSTNYYATGLVNGMTIKSSNKTFLFKHLLFQKHLHNFTWLNGSANM